MSDIVPVAVVPCQDLADSLSRHAEDIAATHGREPAQSFVEDVGKAFDGSNTSAERAQNLIQYIVSISAHK